MRCHRDGDLATLLAEAHERIAELEADRATHAGFDPLTGLADLRQFCLALDVELGRAQRHARPLTVVLLDVDGFTAINAQCGHVIADRVLAAVGATLTGYLRAYDLPARTCDDEFALMLPDTDFEGGRRCLERIMLELSMIELGPLSGISVSAGVASRTEDLHESVPLLGAAARALDRARAGGGGRVSGPSLAET